MAQESYKSKGRQRHNQKDHRHRRRTPSNQNRAHSSDLQPSAGSKCIYRVTIKGHNKRMSRFHQLTTRDVFSHQVAERESNRLTGKFIELSLQVRKDDIYPTG